MQETQVWAQVWEDSTSNWARVSPREPTNHSYWGLHALEATLHSREAPARRNPHTASRKQPLLTATGEKPVRQQGPSKAKNKYKQMAGKQLTQWWSLSLESLHASIMSKLSFVTYLQGDLQSKANINYVYPSTNRDKNS